MVRVDDRARVRYGAALSIGVVAGGSRLLAGVPPLAGYAGVFAGVVVGLWVDSHRPVYHDAIAAAAVGTFLYVVVLTAGAQTGVYSLPGAGSAEGFHALGPLLEPMVFFPLFVVESIAVAVVVKRLRVSVVGDDSLEFS